MPCPGPAEILAEQLPARFSTMDLLGFPINTMKTFLLQIVLVIALLWGLVSWCEATPVKLTWDIQQVATKYHVRERIKNSNETKFLVEVFSNNVTVNVLDGAVLVVTAGNDFGWGEFSDNLTINLDSVIIDTVKNLPVMAFKIEYGDDLTGWETKMFFVQDKARLFARVKVTPVQIYLTPEKR